MLVMCFFNYMNSRRDINIINISLDHNPIGYICYYIGRFGADILRQNCSIANNLSPFS